MSFWVNIQLKNVAQSRVWEKSGSKKLKDRPLNRSNKNNCTVGIVIAGCATSLAASYDWSRPGSERAVW